MGHEMFQCPGCKFVMVTPRGMLECPRCHNDMPCPSCAEKDAVLVAHVAQIRDLGGTIIPDLELRIEGDGYKIDKLKSRLAALEKIQP